MKYQELLLVLSFCNICTGNHTVQEEQLDCVTDYWHQIKCFLNVSGVGPGPGSAEEPKNYTLRFNERVGFHFSECIPSSCRLKPQNSRFFCVATLHPDCFSVDADFTIEMLDGLSHILHKQTFVPFLHIQPKPPHAPVVQHTADIYNISWISGYEDHNFLSSELDYHVLLHTSEGTQPNIFNREKEFILIEESKLRPETRYCICVRSKPSNPDYRSTSVWSEWSPLSCWKTQEKTDQTNLFITVSQCLGPVLVVGGVILLVLYGPTARLKIQTLTYTPSPAPFFQPLFQEHHGNLKEWISPQGKCVLKHNTDSILKAQVVDVVPITKTAEEESDPQDPTMTQDPQDPLVMVTPLLFSQCQCSYVGLPGTHVAPPPLPIIPTLNSSSYTQLPCSLWGGMSFADGNDLNSCPTDFLNISIADSGCSCDDSTLSLPSSPDHAPPPPCYCDDYYTLKPTDSGVVPVLVSRGRHLSVGLQEEQC